MDSPALPASNPATRRLLEQTNWAATPLGPRESWGAELRAMVRLMLDSKVPQHLVWGPERIVLYNDGYIPMIGAKHPAAMGRPLREVRSELWEEIAPLVERVFQGEPVLMENRDMRIERGTGIERVWVSFGYTPVRDDAGAVLGYQTVFFDNTRQVLAERSRSEELALMRTMFDQAPGFIALVAGPSHVFELANDAYQALVGDRELVGRTVADALPEVVDQGFITLLDRVYESAERFVGRRVPVELSRDGVTGAQTRFVDFIYQPLLGPDGRAWGIFVQGADVTDHVNAEEELRRASATMAAAARAADDERARLHALLEAAPVGIGYAGPGGELELINQANVDLWGGFPTSKSIDEYGQWRAWWADGSERHGKMLRPAEWGLARALTGEAVDGDLIEIEPFDRPGVRRTVLLRARPVRNARDELTGAVVAQIDLTDRVAAEAQLRESEAKFRTIADAMPQMVWSTRGDGYADYFNHQWYAFTGSEPGVWDGSGWTEALHPDDRERAADTWRHCAQTGELYEIEYRMRHHSGEFRWVLGRGLPIHDDAGRIIRWMGTCTDIHEHKLARAALEHSEAALRLADRRKDEFLAMLAHELRNPLAPIRTAADVIAMPRTSLERARCAAQVIGRQVAHMTDLVDDLLDVSRVTRGQVMLEREVFDLRDAVRAAVEQVRPLVESKSHSLTVKLTPAPLWVDGDRTRLTQVIANLLNNAAKYTPPGGEVAIDARAVDGRLRVAVRDNGLGIEPALLPQVFELFTQGERTLDRAQGGLGIGLALVKGLMTLHGGSVHAESGGHGRGSRFEIALPAAGAPLPSPAAAEAEPDGAASVRRVVVVDDNPDAASTLCLLLESMGHTVWTFGTAEAALAHPSADTVDAYILDIGLPGMSGLELARVLKNRVASRGAALFALSGYGRAEDREASRAAGFDAHFVKPVDAREILEALTRLARPRETLLLT